MKLPSLFPEAHVLSAAMVVVEGDGRPALYFATTTKSFRLHIHRVPEAATVRIVHDDPLPTKPQLRKGKTFSVTKVTLETPQARTVLLVTTVSGTREAIQALQDYAAAVDVYRQITTPPSAPDSLRKETTG
jgi:hypothetical protein